MRFSRWMAAPLAAAAMIAAGSAVFAASATQTTPPTAPMAAFWSAVAAKVGVPATTLESAVRSVLQQDRQAGTMPKRLRAGRAGALAVRGAFLKTAATYLGVTPKALLADLKSGQSLAQVATASGKSVAGLEAALSARATQAIDQMVQHVGTRSSAAGSASGSTGG